MTMQTRLPTKLRMTTAELRKELAAAKPSKYRNKAVVIDGIRFASQAEGKRYRELKLLEKVGKITNLRLQERIPLMANSVKICTYVADFAYWVNREPVVEDVKGVLTDVFKLKARLFYANFGYDITIVGGNA